MKQTKVTIQGVEYTLQHPGIRARNQMMDRCTNKHGMILHEKLTDEIFEHVVVHPNVRQDDFDEDPVAFEELMQHATTFLRGK